MILSDTDILAELGYGITIIPWEPKRLQPASVDLTLGYEFLETPPNDDMPINPFNIPSGARKHQVAPGVQPDHFLIKPGAFALASTVESIALSPGFAAQVGGKSSLGRLGLQVHATAGFIDPGFEGRITLELSNVGPRAIMLFPGMPVCQIVFSQLKSRSTTPYQGKYQCQAVVTESKYYLNEL